MDAFLKEIHDELRSKMVAQDSALLGSDYSRISTDIVDLVLDKLSICQATDLQLSEDQDLSPDIDTLTTKITHSSLSDLLQESASKVSVYADMKSNKSVLIKREITGYQQKEALAKASSALYRPLKPGVMDEKLFEDAIKSNARCQSPTPCTMGICHRFLEDLISRLLPNILPATASTSSSTEKKMQLAECGLIHMTVISKVIAKISEDENSSCQHIEHPHSREDARIQTIADLVYTKLLIQFQSKFNVQKCLINGCVILSEAVCDLVFQEITGNTLQNSLSGELPLHDLAEPDNIVENTLRDVTEPLDNPNSLSQELSKIVPLIIEKLTANLVSALSSLFPIVGLDAEKMLLLTDATRKIRHAVQVLLSEHEKNVNKQTSEREFLHIEDSQALGDLFHPAYTSTVECSDSDIFVCRDLTNRQDIFAHRIAASIAKKVDKPDFQGNSEEETLPTSSSTTESIKIIERLPTDLGMIKKIPKPTLKPCIPVVPMATVIIEELSDCPLSDSPPTLSQAVMNPDRIADQVSVSAEPKTGSSEEAVPGSTTNETPTETEELPVKRIPHITVKYVPISSDLVSEYLQVISIKAEPLEELQEAFISQTGDGLRNLRASLGEKCFEDESLRSEAQRKDDSLGNIGQRVVRPGEAISRMSFRKLLKPVLSILKPLQPKAVLLEQLAAYCTENEERDEKVEEKREVEQQWEEEELRQTEDTSLYWGSPLTSSMYSEQLSENVEERSPSLKAQRSGIYADRCQTLDIEDSSYMSELETLSEDAERKDSLTPEEMGGDTAAAASASRKQSSFFKKIPNALSRMKSFLLCCLPHHRKFCKVAPEIIATC
ncbi:fibrous sheath-interacting protein 2-like [Alligator mississippiensis]|uniref:fibrous sheath-interacting protein 2-like n=1 Tax=Alligator mississippiensis TaxID=8496 RepID=UPI0028773D3C|nr:fibrous sheath-interacting protein 2-like [Alligator mississippiensis]